MAIRTPLASEIPAVFEIEKDVYGSIVYPSFFFRQALDLWRELFLVSDRGSGSLDGYVIGAPSDDPKVMWVLSLAVRKAHRGQGLGKALMNDLLAAMAAKGARSVKLTVHPSNSAADLYRRLGFIVVGEDPNYFSENDPRLLMELTLAGALL